MWRKNLQNFFRHCPSPKLELACRWVHSEDPFPHNLWPLIIMTSPFIPVLMCCPYRGHERPSTARRVGVQLWRLCRSHVSAQSTAWANRHAQLPPPRMQLQDSVHMCSSWARGKQTVVYIQYTYSTCVCIAVGFRLGAMFVVHVGVLQERKWTSPRSHSSSSAKDSLRHHRALQQEMGQERWRRWGGRGGWGGGDEEEEEEESSEGERWIRLRVRVISLRWISGCHWRRSRWKTDGSWSAETRWGFDDDGLTCLWWQNKGHWPFCTLLSDSDQSRSPSPEPTPPAKDPFDSSKSSMWLGTEDGWWEVKELGYPQLAWLISEYPAPVLKIPLLSLSVFSSSQAQKISKQQRTKWNSSNVQVFSAFCECPPFQSTINESGNLILIYQFFSFNSYYDHKVFAALANGDIVVFQKGTGEFLATFDVTNVSSDIYNACFSRGSMEHEDAGSAERKQRVSPCQSNAGCGWETVVH